MIHDNRIELYKNTMHMPYMPKLEPVVSFKKILVMTHEDLGHKRPWLRAEKDIEALEECTDGESDMYKSLIKDIWVKSCQKANRQLEKWANKEI